MSVSSEETPYRLVGHGGRRIVAFHGWLSDSSCWDGLRPHIDLDRDTWLLLDARGYGREQSRPGPRTLSGYAADGLRAIDALGWDSVTAIGHSMGGIAIQKLALLAPDRVARMIGVAPVPASGAGLRDERLDLFRRAERDRDALISVIDASTGHRRERGWIEHLADRALLACGPGVRRSYLEEWADVDFHEDVAGLDTPVDLLVGAFDPSLNEQRMTQTWQAWYASTTLTVIADAGHYPVDENPAQVAAALARGFGAEGNDAGRLEEQSC